MVFAHLQRAIAFARNEGRVISFCRNHVANDCLR